MIPILNKSLFFLSILENHLTGCFSSRISNVLILSSLNALSRTPTAKSENSFACFSINNL
jgi:hypothetical protein